MSTRCQVIVKDSYSEVWFYRHSDGYPEDVAETLDKFCEWLKEGRIRSDTEQAAGWLVVLGRDEYRYWEKRPYEETAKQASHFEPGIKDGGGWKVGAYEPCAPRMHGDIKFLYIVNVETATWKEASSFDMSGNTYEE